MVTGIIAARGWRTAQMGPNEEKQIGEAKDEYGTLQKVLRANRLRTYYIVLCAMPLLSVGNLIVRIMPEPYCYGLYSLAGAWFIVSVVLASIWVSRIVNKYIMTPIRKIKIVVRVMDDYHLRSILTVIPGTALNLAYAAFNGYLGAVTPSAWYITFAVYYLCLGIMRSYVVLYAKGNYANVKDGEIARQRREARMFLVCGVVFCLMSVTLLGIGILLEHGVKWKTYGEYVIYIICIYTFFKVTMSVRHMVRARKERSRLLIALRNIGFADVLVSLFSLQTAMLAAYAGDDRAAFAHDMTVITCGVVFALILITGVSMVTGSGKKPVGK